jgi:Ca-activated chloride channel family protein
MSLELAHPWALALLLLLPAWAVWGRRRPGPAVVFAPAPVLAALAPLRDRLLGRVPEVARGLAFALLVVALAGPRTGASVVEEEAEGIAIMLAMVVSSSMLAEDFRPGNRLAAAKITLSRFVQGRQYDRIGLVAFAGEALTLVPATIDYAVLAGSIRGLQVGQLNDGTAIGMGLATAANRLARAEGRSKVIILMSDGENNRGDIDPRAAARAAAAYGIRIFTIGVGSRGVARVPVARTLSGLRYGMLPVNIDEPLLREIAATTGGRYYRATDAQALRRIYAEIDRLVKTPVRVRRYVAFTEWYLPFLLGGAAVLLGGWLFRATRWGRVP